jgi:hypothetical protein
MNDYTEEIAREGEYRVTITREDTYAEAPNWDGQGTVVYLDRAGATVQHPSKGDDHGIAYAWEHWSDMELIERYLRMFHGVIGFDYFDTQDGKYVVIVTAKDLAEWGFADLADYRASNPKPEHANPASQVMVAWQAWADGDVYGYTVERATIVHTVTTRLDGSRVGEIEVEDGWEDVESVWGFYGREDAESEAKAALQSHVQPANPTT